MFLRCHAIKLVLSLHAAAAWLACLSGCALTPPPAAAPAAAAAAAPAAAPKQTLWQFLGVPQCFEKIHTHTAQVLTKSGRFPGLEPVANPLLLTDARNKDSSSSAVQAAAKIKKEEDDAQQAVKALRYLGELGCSCHDNDGDITKALVEALVVCVEPVRFEAASVIARLATGEACQYCSQKRCCNPEIIKKLNDIAYGHDDTGCWKEPSARVRRKAIIALTECPGTPASKPAEPLPPRKAADPATPSIPPKPLGPEPPDREHVPESSTDREAKVRPLPPPVATPNAVEMKADRRIGWQPDRPSQDRR